MRNFLIDTDTASDDAVALVMALREPDVNIQAITTVAGNVGLDQATQNALYTTELCQSDVPVYRGASGPLLRPLDSAQDVHGQDGMGDIGLELHGRTPAYGRGVDVIVDAVLAAPGEITLVAIGPLTNLAIALLRAPEIGPLFDRVVIMGGTGVCGPGNITPLAEYNFWADPEAARIVMKSGMPLEIVGWDISAGFAVIDPEREAAFRAVDTPLAHFCLDIQATVRQFVFTETKLAGPDLPDPIAMAHALNPKPATGVRHYVDVLTGNDGARGVFEVDRLRITGNEPNALLVTEYPADDFFAHLHRSCS